MPGETVLIVGTGHTAMDLAASVIRGRGAGRVVAVSRHGELPRSHEDPWRPRPSTPLFTAAELATWPDPIAEARARIRANPDGWRQGLDSLRPIHRDLWLALDEPTRRRFVTEVRRDWEIHRSRISAGVARDIAAWMDAGTLEIRAAGVRSVEQAPTGLRVETEAGSWTAGHVLLATGPDESPSANPLLASLVAAGVGRPGSMDLGIDVDVATCRLLDADGGSATAGVRARAAHPGRGLGDDRRARDPRRGRLDRDRHPAPRPDPAACDLACRAARRSARISGRAVPGRRRGEPLHQPLEP